MLTNAQMQTEIMDALAELKALADGVEAVKARLLVLYGRLDAPRPPVQLPTPTPPPPGSPITVMMRDLANGFPTDRDGFVVRMTVGAGLSRHHVEAALAELINDGRVVEATSGSRVTIRIPRDDVTLGASRKSPMTLSIERGILHALDAAPGTDHATVVDAVARLHGIGRVMVQFVLTDMVSERRLSVHPGPPGSLSNSEPGRLIVL